MNLTPETQRVVNLCKKAFNRFDEIWLIGHKGDHHRTLVDLGVLDNQRSTITLAHVHSTLGIKARYLLKPPRGSALSVEAAHKKLNPLINKHIKRTMSQNKKVCILAPFSNRRLDKLIAINKAGKNITVTSPTKDCEDFFEIGNKLVSSELIENALLDKKSINEKLTGILIPWKKFSKKDMIFSKLKKFFNLSEKQGVYLQVDISASGDGTELIKSQQDLDLLFSDNKWLVLSQNGRLKVSPEILNTYPANGSACIVPTGKGECIVLVDPLSHKPTGLLELKGKEHSGVGNDWSQLWPDYIQTQYINSAILIGNLLYKKYGYTGIFGPDYIVERQKNGKSILRITEINPRWQGTTSYQTFNALIAKRIPLELIHYVIKLDQDGSLLPKLLSLIGDVDAYNKLSVSTKGCFYIKIGSPKRTKLTKKNMNGCYLFTGSELFGPFKKVNDLDVIKDKTKNISLESHRYILKKQSKYPLFINIKAPSLNERVGGVSLTPIGYIFGKSDTPIFLSYKPGVSDYGKKLYDLVNDMIFNS